METIIRDRDLICETNEKVEEIYCFPNFPINMISDLNRPEDDPVMDMQIGINRKTGFIQLMRIPSPDELYTDAHFNTTGGVWTSFHQKMSKTLKKLKPKRILEVGGGVGMLEVIYNSSLPKTESWKIIEPVIRPLPECNAEYISGFFPEAVSPNEEFDVLVHSHVMEHTRSPRGFMEDVKRLLPEKGRMVFAVPNMKRNMQEKVTSVINFEHSIFLTEDYIEYLLGESGFFIDSKEYYLDHSIIFSVHKTDRVKPPDIDFSLLYDENIDIFRQYVTWHKEKMSNLNQKMESENRNVIKLSIFLGYEEIS